jgi:hypothetical protein
MWWLTYVDFRAVDYRGSSLAHQLPKQRGFWAAVEQGSRYAVCRSTPLSSTVTEFSDGIDDLDKSERSSVTNPDRWRAS